MNRIFLPLVLTLIVYSSQAQDCGCDHTIAGDNSPVKIFNASSFDYSPGDVFCIEAGDYSSLRFIGFNGTAEAPIVFKNCGGVVNIDGDTYSGIAFWESNFIHFTGTGVEGEEYGVHVKGSGGGSVGFGVSNLSSDFEIDHLKIGNVGFAGIMAKTDPKCDQPETWRENYTLRNLHIHHNHIYDTEGEGMYIGGTFGYHTSTLKCDGVERFAHFLENVQIHDNYLENTGWDGIQVNLVPTGVAIYDNTINGYGTAKQPFQVQGMSLGGIRGQVYNNKIYQNPENTTDDQFGMSLISILDNTYFYNNLIERSGSYGIWLHQRLPDEYFDVDGGFYFVNNTIVEPGKSGTFLNTDAGNGARNYLNYHYINNLVVNPGIDFTTVGIWKGDQESYFDFLTPTDKEAAVVSSNVMTRSFQEAGFINTDDNFNLFDYSVAVDAGENTAAYGVQFDLNNSPRPFGDQYDVGAYEYGATGEFTLGFDDEVGSGKQTIINGFHPNPVKDEINFTANPEISQFLIRIYDTSGKVILEESFINTGSEMNLDLKGLQLDQHQVLFMHIENSELNQTIKLIKN